MVSIYKILAVQGTTERACTIDKFHLSQTIETTYTQIKQLNQSLSSTEQNLLIKELHRDCDYYNTLSDIKETITIGLMGFPLLLSIYSLWVDRNGIKFSDYTSTLKYILVFNIFCLFIFVITSTLKNHWVNNAKYLLDILGDE